MHILFARLKSSKAMLRSRWLLRSTTSVRFKLQLVRQVFVHNAAQSSSSQVSRSGIRDVPVAISRDFNYRRRGRTWAEGQLCPPADLLPLAIPAIVRPLRTLLLLKACGMETASSSLARMLEKRRLNQSNSSTSSQSVSVRCKLTEKMKRVKKG